MKKRNNLLALTTSILAFFLTLVGCGKAKSENNVVSQDQPISSSSIEKEAKTDKTRISRETGDLVPKAAPLVYPTATLRYTGLSNIRANDAGITSLAETLNLDKTIFSATYVKNSGSDVMFLRTDGIWMYGLKNESTKGNKLTITMSSGYNIRFIDIDFIEGYSSTAEISSSGDVKTGTNGRYEINGNSFVIFVNDGAVSENLQVRFNSIVIEYELPTTQEAIEYGLTTSSSLSYQYDKDETNVVDTINKTFTGIAGSYTDWSGKIGESTIVYAGYASGRNGYLNLNTSGDVSGIVSTSNSTGFFAKKIVLTWNTATVSGRTIDVYGKDTSYASASDLYNGETQGSLLGSLEYNKKDEENKTTLIISSSFDFIGIKSRSDALYLDSIDIQWGTSPVYDYSNVAIRFGNLMEQSLWDDLNAESTIKGYGVMLSTPGYLDGKEIKEWYADNSMPAVDEDDLDAAIATACGENANAVKNFYTKITGEKTNPAEATAAQKSDLEGDYYIWNLYKEIATSDIKAQFTAVAYIRTISGIVFLRETTASAKGLAADLIDNDVYADDSFDGSLHELANLA